MNYRYEIIHNFKQVLDENIIIISEIEQKNTIEWTINELKTKTSVTFIFEESFQRTMEWVLQNHPELLL
jgi:hypothetical protein